MMLSMTCSFLNGNIGGMVGGRAGRGVEERYEEGLEGNEGGETAVGV